MAFVRSQKFVKDRNGKPKQSKKESLNPLFTNNEKRECKNRILQIKLISIILRLNLFLKHSIFNIKKSILQFVKWIFLYLFILIKKSFTKQYKGNNKCNNDVEQLCN